LSVEQVDSLRTALLTISNGDEAVLLVQALPTFAWQIVHEYVVFVSSTKEEGSRYRCWRS